MNIFLTLAILFITACTPQAQKSLLSSPQICTDISCTQTAATDIAGDLSISPDLSATTMNIEKSDLVEISGSCQDLGRKNNRMIVQVFHVEDDPSILPYIDNSISSNCQLNPVGLLTTQQCFFVTHGNGLVENGQAYPQCINGRFSFKVRLGSVSKIGAVVKKYLIQTKIRTLNPTGESGWAQTTVIRNISAPPFSLTIDTAKNQCIIKIEPYKFKDLANAIENIPAITYAIKRQESGFTAMGLPNPAVVPAILPDRLAGTGFYPFDASQIDLGDSVLNFFDGKTSAYIVLAPTVPLSVQPGVSYTYATQARAGLDDSIISSVLKCNLPAPGFLNITTTGTVCSLPISVGGGLPFTYEWVYSAVKDWTSSNSNAGTTPITTPAACTGLASSGCNFEMAALPAGQYYVAVRTMSALGLYGKWSQEIPCKRP